jgi:precorrin-2 dehydrogenase/sirohydrochlorin ferrochelatase
VTTEDSSVGSSETSLPVSTPLMFPLMLNITAVPIMVIGGGVAYRVTALEEYGATVLHVFSAAPTSELMAVAGERLVSRWPTEEDFAALQPRLVFVSDVTDDLAAGWYAMAKAVGALVHVQDRIPLCDFHLPARVRRGHLQVTVSTDGTAAGLSRHIREYLETHVFGPEWAARVDEVAAARRKWKQDGLSFGALGKAVADLVAARGWFKKP